MTYYNYDLEKEEPFYQRETDEGIHYGSIAFETGVGVAADFILGSPDPVSRLLSFGVGYGSNAIAQWMRGDLDDFSHGEAWAAGGFQAIPFGSVAKGLKGVKRATAKGIAGGIGMEQVRVGIDEQRRLTAKEVVLSGLTGGIVSGGFQAGGEVIGNTYRQFTGLTEGLGGAGIRSMEGSRRKVSAHMQKKVELQVRAMNDDFLQWDRPAVERRKKIDKQFQFTKSGELEGPHQVFAGSTESGRRAKAKWSLGEEVSPADIKIFEESNQSILDGYNWHLHGSQIKVGKTEGHHKGVVRQIFDASNGLNKEYRGKSAVYMQQRIGFELGYHGRNVHPVPERFHPRVHGMINARISSSPDLFNVEGAAIRLGFPENWQSVLTYEERLPLYNEVADAIRESVDAINLSWQVLLSRTDDLTTWSKEDWFNMMLRHHKLDEKLSKISSPHFMARSKKTGWGLKETSTTVLNDLLVRSGRQDLTLPSFIRQVEADMPPGLKNWIIKNNAWELVKEMVVTGQSSTQVMKSYPPIKMTQAQRNSLEKYVTTIRRRNTSVRLTDELGMRSDD